MAAPAYVVPTPLAPGRLPEWPKGADCKSAGSAYVGSNPTAATTERTSRPCSRGVLPFPGVASLSRVLLRRPARLRVPIGLSGHFSLVTIHIAYTFRRSGLPTDYLRFILVLPWWSFPRAITRAFPCPQATSMPPRQVAQFRERQAGRVEFIRRWRQPDPVVQTSASGPLSSVGRASPW